MLPDGFDFNVGVDCEEIDRWRKLLPDLDRDNSKSYFSSEEHEYCRSFADAATHYAGRWCAKEAVVKALAPLCKLTARDVKILNDQSGAPCAVLAPAQPLEHSFALKLSISHTGTTAIACAVVVFKQGREPA